MADLTTDDVRKLAHLARINVNDDEAAHFSDELQTILEYVEHLQAVDIEGLKPTDQVSGLKNVMRADEPQDYGYTPDDLLDKSLSVQDRQLKVKRMLNG